MSDIHALSGAYAVDALDDLERARFRQHLETCPACREEVAGLREATAALGALETSAPPPALRDRVLSEARRVRPLPPPDPGGPTAPAARRRRPGRRWVPAMVAAVLLAVLGVGAAVIRPWAEDQGDHGTHELTAAEQVLRAPDAASVSQTLPDGARVTVTRSVRRGSAVLRVRGMTAVPADKVYQLWLQDPDGTMSPAGLMPRGPDHTMMLRGDAARAVGTGITVEPAGGSAQPTSEPVALLDLRKATRAS